MTAPAAGAAHPAPARLRAGADRTVTRRAGWRIQDLIRGRGADPGWARPAAIGLLALTAVLYLAGLSRNGWANDFYSAAVQAGSTSWKAFFFGSFDGASSITVDKTPASLWVMELSARVFGLNYWSVLVPQALAGVACVGVLYVTVKRWFGPAAGLLAGAVLALTPVAALMFRFNNPDALLVLLLTAAAYGVTRAIESGRTRWSVLAGALIGFGFLTKMLQAFLVLPPYALACLVAGPPRLGKRVVQLLAAGAAVVVAAGWWVAAVMLIPAADRPYVGGSTTNSILQLALGYNGLGRLNGNETGSVGFGGGRGGSPFGGGSGLTRLFSAEMGGQIAWLLPAALIALAGIVWLSWGAGRARREGGLSEAGRLRAAALIWGGSLLVTGGVFSYMAGIFHPYYTVALAPAIGALVGIGAVEGWRRRDQWAGRILLSVMLAVTALWSGVLLNRTPSWHPWVHVLVLVCGLLAAAVLAAWPALVGVVRQARRRTALAAGTVVLGLTGALAGPAAYTLATVSSAHTGAIPSAGPSTAAFGGGPGGGFGGRPPGGFGNFPAPGGATSPGGGTGTGGNTGPGAGTFPGGGTGTGTRPGAGGGFGRPGGGGGPGGGLSGNTQVSSALVKLLEQNAGHYTWVAATVGTQSAAPLQLATRHPVMAIGGFNGSDPSPTLAQFQKLVAAGKIHWFVGESSSSFGGGTGTAAQITSWVAAHYQSRAVGGITVYDLSR
ncbi:MAG TPA: glycosyltransferase family 39 protein [Streptosporangiaceae bacterium]|nr:glycosyltransferase family 39 protein [Streptosporangiaceae bacterium]